MRIVVAHTAQYHPLAKAAHDKIPGIERFDVSKRIDSYQSLLMELWCQGESFLLMEEDIEPTTEAIEEALGCDCSWGTNPYFGPGTNPNQEQRPEDVLLFASLGFVRFDASLMAAEPDMLVAVAALNDGKDVPPGHWRRLDARIKGVLNGRDYEPHIHEHIVLHHHVYNGYCACKTEHESFPVDDEGRYRA